MPLDTPATTGLFEPLVLPNGAIVPNRICKAAMEENLADDEQRPGEALRRLYARWAAGGAGLILTGNVMVDARAATGPGAVVLEDERGLDAFKAWAAAGRAGGAQFWMQISHPGRQTYAALTPEVWAPSDVAVDIPGFSKLFSKPRAMTEAEIAELIERFATTAALAERAGFTGVQIHAAHGYLVSQFLSPLVNRRTDSWGGPLENRARLLLEIVRRVRARVAPGFAVAVKLNSADFQRGGFGPDEARRVVEWLNDLGVDLIELSGGSYESPAMQGNPQEGSTGAREAYFIDFARDIAAVARMPVMVTGGIHRRAVAEEALSPQGNRFGVAVLGLATALAFEPDLPARWKAGANADVAIPRVGWRSKPLAALATMAVIKTQIRRLSQDRDPDPGVSPAWALIADQVRTRRRTTRYRRWLAGRA